MGYFESRARPWPIGVRDKTLTERCGKAVDTKTERDHDNLQAGRGNRTDIRLCACERGGTGQPGPGGIRLAVIHLLLRRRR